MPPPHYVMKWVKVRGHAEIPANERCDALVRREMAGGLVWVTGITLTQRKAPPQSFEVAL
jgi:ribonuclease HI